MTKTCIVNLKVEETQVAVELHIKPGDVLYVHNGIVVSCRVTPEPSSASKPEPSSASKKEIEQQRTFLPSYEKPLSRIQIKWQGSIPFWGLNDITWSISNRPNAEATFQDIIFDLITLYDQKPDTMQVSYAIKRLRRANIISMHTLDKDRRRVYRLVRQSQPKDSPDA